MICAAYVRVSSRQQDLEAQKHSILRAATARGDEIGQWYGEKASGAALERAALTALRAAVRRGAYRKLYVFRLDRLSRSMLGMFSVVDELARNGCELVSVADGFDPSGPTGPIVLAVLAACAQMERDALAERLHAARERARSRGLDWGRPRALTADTLRLARKAIAEGSSLRNAARELDVSVTTLHRALKRVPDPSE